METICVCDDVSVYVNGSLLCNGFVNIKKCFDETPNESQNYIVSIFYKALCGGLKNKADNLKELLINKLDNTSSLLLPILLYGNILVSDGENELVISSTVLTHLRSYKCLNLC